MSPGLARQGIDGAMGRGSSCLQSHAEANACGRVANAPTTMGLRMTKDATAEKIKRKWVETLWEDDRCEREVGEVMGKGTGAGAMELLGMKGLEERERGRRRRTNRFNSDAGKDGGRRRRRQ